MHFTMTVISYKTSLISFQYMTQLGFTIVVWHHSEIWLVLPTKFLAAEVIGWTCVSCQAVSPMAWEWGWRVFLSYKRTSLIPNIGWYGKCVALSDNFSSLQFARWLCSSQFGRRSKIPFHQEHMPLIRTTMVHELRTGKLVQYKLWLWILILYFLNLNYLSDSNYNKSHLF